MIAQRPAHIFKADTRGIEFSDHYCCLSTFTYHESKVENGAPFGSLTVFEDETLSPGKQKSYHLEEDSLIILIPLVGILEVGEPHGNGRQLLIPEQLKVMALKNGQSFHLCNPHEKNLANYLQIRLKADGKPLKKSFGEYHNNELFPLLKMKGYRLYFGVFDGRKEATYKLKNLANGVFSFVINGTFELENRLLENRDGLSLWNSDTIEMEALSENAMLLLLEVPLKENNTTYAQK